MPGFWMLSLKSELYLNEELHVDRYLQTQSRLCARAGDVRRVRKKANRRDGTSWTISIGKMKQILSKYFVKVINEMTDKLKSQNFEVVVKNGGEDNEVVMNGVVRGVNDRK